MRKLSMLFFLVFITALMPISAEPFEDSGQPGFKFYGWSRDGKAAYLEMRDSTGYGQEIYFCVINCVTDKYVIEERFDDGDFEAWESDMGQKAENNGIILTYDEADLKFNDRDYTFSAWLVVEGKVYYISECLLMRNDPHCFTDVDGGSLKDGRICVFKLRNLLTGVKYIGAKYVTAPLGPMVGSVELIAVYTSPYEKRGVLVIKENTVSHPEMEVPDTNIRYRFIGCDLEYGFEDTAEFRALKAQFEVNR